jgi:hypothetical protein
MLNPLHGMGLPKTNGRVLLGFLIGDLVNSFANYLVYGVVYKVFYAGMSNEALNIYWALPLAVTLGIGAMHTKWRMPARAFVPFKVALVTVVVGLLLSSLVWDVFLVSLVAYYLLHMLGYELCAPYYNTRRSKIFNNDLAKEAEYQLRVRYLTALVSALGAVSIFVVPVSVTGGLIALALTEVLDVSLDVWAHNKLEKEERGHGVVVKADDLHNVEVDYENGKGLYCLVKGCQGGHMESDGDLFKRSL